MSEKTLEELKLEADSLGITYSPNIGAAKLQAKIDAFYDDESAENSEPVEVKEEVVEETKEVEVKKSGTLTRAEALRVIKEQEKANRETVVVKITCVDKREASTATNAYFATGDTAMNVPLDVYVEMPKILVYQAENAKAQVHMETDKGAVSKWQKKYVVDYKDGKK